MQYLAKSKTLSLNKVPFNITFVMPHKNTIAGLLPINSLAITDNRTNDFHSQGLYSNQIFGKPGTKERDTRLSYIPLRTQVFHPLYYKELIKLKGLYGQIIMGEAYANWDDVEKDFVPAKGGIMEGETGFSFFMRHWNDLVFKQGKSQKRMLRIAMLEAYRDRALTDFFLVIPAGLRDVQMDGDRPVEEDINKLYKKVISAAAAINPSLGELHPTILDFPKRQLQKSIIAVDDYLHNILEGKRGFLTGKFGARKVFGTTRNVLSSMEMESEYLGDERQPDLNTTVVGLFQYIKAAEPLVVDYYMPRGILSNFFESLDEAAAPVVDPKTLKATEIILDAKQRDKWGTTKGLEDLLGGFKFKEVRHHPVTVQGYYIKLVYQDDKHYRVMSSIDELPEGWDKSKVRPLTWGELFYLSAKDSIPKVRCYNTRYPVTGLGSIFPNKVYVRTTVRSYKLIELDENFQPTENVALEYPDAVNQLGWVDTMAVNSAYLPHLGADKMRSQNR